MKTLRLFLNSFQIIKYKVVRSKKQFVIVLKGLIKDKKRRTFMSNAAKRIAHKFTWREADMKTEGILKNVIKTNKK